MASRTPHSPVVDWSPPGVWQWFFMPKLWLAPSSLGFSLHTHQGWAGTGTFLAMLLFICNVDTKSQQSVNCGFRVCFSAGAEYISVFSLYCCWRKITPASCHPPRTASAVMLSTSNSSTSQVDIIRNPKVNNLIISSAQRLVCRRSDSRKSAAQIRAGKMPDFKKETGRDPEERDLPNPSLVTYFGPSVLQ